MALLSMEKCSAASFLRFLHLISLVKALTIGGHGSYVRTSPLPDSHHDDSLEPKIWRFLDWLQAEECEGIEATEISVRNHLRGVFARESFQAGEYILGIPYVSSVLVHEAIIKGNEEEEEEEEEEESDVQKGLAFLQQQSVEEFHERWEPYLDCLPTTRSHFHATPDFWPDDVIEKLEVPKLVQETLHRKQEIQQLSLQNDGVLFDELQFATWLVRSRGFSIVKVLSRQSEATCIMRRTVLIPYMDFLNHSFHPNAEIRTIDSKNDDETFFALAATCSIQPGEEILISYGTGFETTLDLLNNYGFWLPDNPNDVHLDLTDASWTTTLEQDELQLKQNDDESLMSYILTLRCHLKRIQQTQNHDS